MHSHHDIFDVREATVCNDNQVCKERFKVLAINHALSRYSDTSDPATGFRLHYVRYCCLYYLNVIGSCSGCMMNLPR